MPEKVDQFIIIMIRKTVLLSALALGVAMALPAFAETTSTVSTAQHGPSTAMISCVGTAVSARETALGTGIGAYTQAISAAYSARATALSQAYQKTTGVE